MDALSMWRKWLLLVSLCIVAFGLLLAFCSQTPLKDLVIGEQIDTVFWPGGTPENLKPYQSWRYGTLGAHVAAFGVIMAFVVHYGFREGRRWAWNCVAVAITVWFVGDTTVSVYHGVWFNVVFNTGIFLAVWIPLLLSKRCFPRDPDEPDEPDEPDDEGEK